MFESFEELNSNFAKQLPRGTITILRESGYTYSGTGMRTPSYSETTATAYVGLWSVRQIEQSAGRLSLSSKKLILVGVEVLPTDLIQIGDVVYKIDLPEYKRGYTVLGVSKK